MKTQSFLVGASMISSLGFSLIEHQENLLNNRAGIKLKNTDFGEFYVSAIDENKLSANRLKWNISSDYSRMEAMSIISIEEALSDAGRQTCNQDVQLFLASTKGNIDHISNYSKAPTDQLHLTSSVKKIKAHFHLTKEPITVCNACTSGLMAIIMASRMIQAGHIKEAIVCGVDVISNFTLQGFTALHAMDDKPCRPFDKSRNGISLGEGCAAAIISSEPAGATIEILGGGTNNDANHISGPSRTGEGLKKSITQALRISNLSTVDYINAHGTATRYNDEMEAQAFYGLDLSAIPTHSLKGYWGHTLGAAGVLETIGAALAMQTNTVYSTVGYETHGLTLPLNVSNKNQHLTIHHGLKTSSGFGGSNAALVLKSC